MFVFLLVCFFISLLLNQTKIIFLCSSLWISKNACEKHSYYYITKWSYYYIMKWSYYYMYYRLFTFCYEVFEILNKKKVQENVVYFWRWKKDILFSSKNEIQKMYRWKKRKYTRMRIMRTTKTESSSTSCTDCLVRIWLWLWRHYFAFLSLFTSFYACARTFNNYYSSFHLTCHLEKSKQVLISQ